MTRSSQLLCIGLVAICIIVVVLGFIFWAWFYTTSRLNAARLIGIFPSPSEGMLTLVYSEYTGIQEARIVQALPERVLGGMHHIWYVIACVWADSRVDSSLVGYPGFDYDAPGS